MGWAIVPDLDDEATVCQIPCLHPDCAAMQSKWKNAKCVRCGKPMEAGQKYYLNDDNQPEHAVCVWEFEERKQREIGLP